MTPASVPHCWRSSPSSVLIKASIQSWHEGEANGRHVQRPHPPCAACLCGSRRRSSSLPPWGSCAGRPRARLRPRSACRQHSHVGTRQGQTHTRRTLRAEQSRGRGRRSVGGVCGRGRGSRSREGTRASACRAHTGTERRSATESEHTHATRAHAQTRSAQPFPSVPLRALNSQGVALLCRRHNREEGEASLVRLLQLSLDGCILACGALLFLWWKGLRW